MSLVVFSLLVVFLILQRLWELRRSQQNVASLLANGGREFYPRHYLVMVALHTGWIVSMLVEVWWRQPTVSWYLALPAAVFVIAGQALRYHAIRTLGPRWNTRIVLIPGTPALRQGLYRVLRHPNYLGVVLEIAAFPLLHSAWWTALGFSLANGVLLWHRIRCEEAALREFCQYDDVFSETS